MRDHDAGKRPITFWPGRFFDKPLDDAALVSGNNAALPWIGYLVDGKGDRHLHAAMEGEHLRQVDIGEHVTIKDEKSILILNIAAIFRQGPGAAQQFCFL